MRITQQMLSQRALDAMQTNINRLANLQEQAVTTKSLQRPEDDPFAVQQAMGFRARIQEGETILDNVALGRDWLDANDGALTDLTTLLGRAEVLALKGASEQLGAGERAALATEMEGIIEQAIGIGNTRHGDQFLFAGFKTNATPFQAVLTGGLITGATYVGDAGSILRQVEPGVDMAINVPGQPLFGGVFGALIGLRDAVRANPFDVGDVTTALGDVKDQTDNVLDVQSSIGTKMNRLDLAAGRTEVRQLGLESLLSRSEDADMAEVVSDLAQQQFVYQTALAVNAQVLRLSLMDYLR